MRRTAPNSIVAVHLLVCDVEVIGLSQLGCAKGWVPYAHERSTNSGLMCREEKRARGKGRTLGSGHPK